MQETTRVAPGFTVRVYSPSRVVDTPLLVPFSITVAPITGCLDTSKTVPDTFCWAKALAQKARQAAATSASFLETEIIK